MHTFTSLSRRPLGRSTGETSVTRRGGQATAPELGLNHLCHAQHLIMQDTELQTFRASLQHPSPPKTSLTCLAASANISQPPPPPTPRPPPLLPLALRRPNGQLARLLRLPQATEQPHPPLRVSSDRIPCLAACPALRPSALRLLPPGSGRTSQHLPRSLHTDSPPVMSCRCRCCPALHRAGTLLLAVGGHGAFRRGGDRIRLPPLG